MKTIIEKQRFSSIFHEGKFYDTGKELNLSFSEAMRLSRVTSIKAEYDRVEYNPDLWKNEKFINFFGDIDLSSGFGNCSYYLVKESMEKLKIALLGKTFSMRDQSIHGVLNRALRQDGAMIWHDQPREQWLYSPFRKNIAIIPWETTLIPASWVGKINQFDALFVPCRKNIANFRDSGIRIPIELIRWGVDPSKFHYIQRPERSTFTFGTMGALSIRKGTDILISAFREEFPTEKDVKLICKTSFNNYPFSVKDSRIEVQMMQVTNKELMDNFFSKIDCFVFPTRGEGWGMTPMEAMATGVPAIVTGWSGPLEYADKNDTFLIDHTMVPAIEFSKTVYKENCGNWAEPSKEHLKKLMRYAYENRQEIKEKGEKASERILREFSWQESIKVFHSALDKHL